MSQEAPGRPGIPPRWTSSGKTGVGTALNAVSRVWFTLSHGILNEIFYPRVDQACTRDLGMLVSDGRDFFSEEKRHTKHEICHAPAVPAYSLTNTCEQGRYRMEKRILADPARSTVLQRTRFTALQGKAADYHVHALLAPHLANHGADNTAWIGDYKGVPMLFAERDGRALALACSSGWRKRSAGYVGFSDGWQDVSRHFEMQWEFERAEQGNVALIGEVAVPEDGEFVLALGFDGTWWGAAQMALASLSDGFEAAEREYERGWNQWQESLLPVDDAPPADLYRFSAAVLRMHEAKLFAGGIIASLSIPWGFAKGDDDLGGYHLVWPRDLVETAGGLLAAGDTAGARTVLDYLNVTQEGDGHWPQNMWLDGQAYWSGVQMDETAFPILLTDLLRRHGGLADGELARYWPMVRRAAAYLVQNGPVTGQDRWEEDPGYSPFTLAVEIAALLVAAELAERCGEPGLGPYLQETADAWNDAIERCIYVEDGDFGRRHGVAGYYIRIAPREEEPAAASPKHGFVPIKNRPPAESDYEAEDVISTDFLALVRFGLRAADDPRIVSTVRLCDQLLKVDVPQGTLWRRYNHDGYGEHEDGSPFDGTGIGRAWPLLAAERAHYELAAGRRAAAAALLKTVRDSADGSGLIPEQTWDAPDLPERELFFGRPSGSARPLVWAHAEYIKLVRSLCDGAVFDCPPQTAERYLVKGQKAQYALWSPNNKTREMPAGKTLRLVLPGAARVRWTAAGRQTPADIAACPTGLGTCIADLPTAQLPAGGSVSFSLYWEQQQRWEDVNYEVAIR
jgi:glucoamylase